MMTKVKQYRVNTPPICHFYLPPVTPRTSSSLKMNNDFSQQVFMKIPITAAIENIKKSKIPIVIIAVRSIHS